MNDKNPYYLHEQQTEMKTINFQGMKNNPYQTNLQVNQQYQKHLQHNQSQNNQNNYPYQNQGKPNYPYLPNNNPSPQHNPPIMPYPAYQPPPQHPPLNYPPTSSASIYPYMQNRPQQSYSPFANPQSYSHDQYSTRSANSIQLTQNHCPFCNMITNSFVQEKPIMFAWIICFLLFCFTVFLFWIPFCFQSCKERRFRCVHCKRIKYVVRNSC